MIISNTTPIVCFININRLDILETIFREITIPEGVYSELVIKNREKAIIKSIIDTGFLQIVPFRNVLAVNLLRKQVGLGIGESEAIVLAQELEADILLMDERKGRKVAEECGIKITGTLGILMHAKSIGLIDKVRPLIDELIGMSVRIDKKLYESILIGINE